jgi:transcription antitermination protein NusB
MLARRRARETALQSLFEIEFADNKGANPFQHKYEISNESREYADFLVSGVQSKLVEIDSAIESHSHNWKMKRMALVDKNILRIAIFELLHSAGAIPTKTAINEAVELAKKFGSNDSHAFINGILDQIAKGAAPNN